MNKVWRPSEDLLIDNHWSKCCFIHYTVCDGSEQDGILNTEHDLCSYNKTINTHVITPVCNTRIVPQPACAAVCREWQMLHNQRLEIIQSAPGFCDSWRISNYILWTSFLLLFITMWFPLFCVNLISVWWSSVPLTITRVCCCGYFWTFWAHMSPAMMIISIYSPQFLLLDTQECFIVGTWDSF